MTPVPVCRRVSVKTGGRSKKLWIIRDKIISEKTSISKILRNWQSTRSAQKSCRVQSQRWAFSPIMHMYLTEGLSTWALAILSHFSCPYHNKGDWLILVRTKLPLTNWLSQNGDGRKRDREKSLGQTHLFNNWTIGAMGRTSGQPEVKLSLLRSISLKIRLGGGGDWRPRTTYKYWGLNKLRWPTCRACAVWT